MKKYSIATFFLLATLVLSLSTSFAFASEDDRYDDSAELKSLREENQRLREEIKSLQEQIADMQLVLMEQIKVIMETLANVKSQ